MSPVQPPPGGELAPAYLPFYSALRNIAELVQVN